MENKKSCKHKNGFKPYIWITPEGSKTNYIKCVDCKKVFKAEEGI